MSEVLVSVLLTLFAPVLVVAFAFVAATASRLLGARSRGGPTGPAVRGPAQEVLWILRQQRRITLGADALLWRIGGGGLIVAAMLMAAVVPIGARPAADLPLGVVWFNLIDVAVWACWWLLGWGGNSAYALIGGYRFLAQALAYELPLMFALTTPAVAAASLNVPAIVRAQDGAWFAVTQPVAFLVFIVSVACFSAWGPFAAAARVDIAGGVALETSGVDRLLVKAGRWALLAAGAMFAVPLFLGGGAGPVLPEMVWFVLKVAALLAVMVVLGRLLPPLQPQRLAEIGWVLAVPLTLLQLLVTSVMSAMGGI